MSSPNQSGQRSDGGPLRDLVVLDLTNQRAELAGRLLADLGAEVIKIEPPGGVDSRRRPPFEARSTSPSRSANESLYWASVGIGKKSAVLDLEAEDDRTLLLRCVAAADVLVESAEPGAMQQLGLGPETLSELNPRLVYCAVTPYGQSGPKAKWPTTELTLEADGGRLALQGDPDRPPLPMGFPHSYFHAGAQAAADIVIALNERSKSGRGQFLDTSIQECMVWTLMGPYTWPAMTGSDPPGTAEDRNDPAALSDLARLFPRLCECSDGWVAVAMSPLGQSRGGGIIPQVMRELRARGELSDALSAIDWDDWETLYREGRLPEPEIVSAVGVVEDFLRARTKAELLEWTLAHKLRLGPIRTTEDLVADQHLENREFFQELAGRLHPGLPARSDRLPRTLLAPAPRLGEHQRVLEDLLDRDRPAPRRRPRRDPSRRGEAFEGLKVADFSWVVAGPTIGKALADHGATVVRVESSRRPDLARRLPPMKDDLDGLNRSGWATLFNTSKLSLALDLTREEGIAVARRLIDWADVVIQSFSPGTMEKFGLGWETISEGRDDLVLLSTSLFGTGGPLTRYAGFGQQAAAMVGLHAITGWPDRAPCGPYGPYTDVVAPKFGVSALAAALLEREHSGRGQHIELSQAETGIRFLEPLFLDQTVNGHTRTAVGMASELAHPHGVFAAAEPERYVAIATETDEQRHALLVVLGSEPKSLKLGSEPLDSALAEWCASRPARTIERRLVEANVPCAVVQRPTDLYSDPQLEHREFRQVLDHREMGPWPFDSLATHFSAKSRALHAPTPCLGEHTESVLKELLGYDEDELAQLTDVLV